MRSPNSIDFRPNYRELSPEEKARLDAIKDAATKLDEHYTALLDAGAGYRHVALAKTNLEQSVMWAVKAATGPNTK